MLFFVVFVHLVLRVVFRLKLILLRHRARVPGARVRQTARRLRVGHGDRCAWAARASAQARASAAESSVCSHACSDMAHGPTRGGRAEAERSLYRLQSGGGKMRKTDGQTHAQALQVATPLGVLTIVIRVTLFALREEVGAAAHVLQPQRAGARRLAEHNLGIIAAEALVQLLQQRLAVQLHELRHGRRRVSCKLPRRRAGRRAPCREVSCSCHPRCRAGSCEHRGSASEGFRKRTLRHASRRSRARPQT